MNHGPEGSTPWLGLSAFTPLIAPLPEYTQTNTTAFPLKGHAKKIFWCRQTHSNAKERPSKPELASVPLKLKV